MYTFILGNKDYLDKDTISKYQTNGLSHLFALSGMHINFFILYLSIALRRFF